MHPFKIFNNNMSHQNLIQDLISSVKKAQNQSINVENVFSDTAVSKGKNEFLFFVKPEITMASDKINLEAILRIVFDKIEQFGFNIHNIKVLSAKYLEQYNIIAQHYGVINKIASDAVHQLSEGAKAKFEEIYGVKFSDVKVMGGVEFLNYNKHFDAYSLDYLWQNTENQKLAGGTYCEKLKFDAETIYVINGFHPRQLKHFTEEGRSIIVMSLSSDTDWNVARSKFIGATNPVTAESGSLRKTFLEQKESLGLAEVSQGVNGVHLSAGPVEGLVELKRYNSDFSKADGVMEFESFAFGKKLKDSFGEKMNEIVGNFNVNVDGKMVSVFDITEEMNAEQAMEVLRKHF